MATENHKVSPSKLLLSLLHGERQEITVILLYGLGVGLLSLAIPVGVQTLVSTVNFGSMSQPVLFLVFVVFMGLSFAAVLRAIQIKIVEQFQKRFFTQVALELAYRIPRLSLEGKLKYRFPELVNRFFDVLTVQKSGATLLLDGFALALQIVLGLILLAFYHWFLLAFAIVLIGIIGFILFVLGRGAVATSIQESVQKYRVAAWLEDLAARPLLFRSQASRGMALAKADEIVQGYLKARGAHFRILMRQVLGSLALQAIASSALLGLGAFLVIRSQLTLGQLVAAEIVVTTALGSLAKFQKHLEAFYDLVAALDKLDGLFSLGLEQSGGEEVKSNSEPAALEVRDLVYSFDSKQPLFKEISFQVESGARIALLGSNSSGKTTLVDLLFGIRSADSGSILLDGSDYRDLSRESVRNQVSLVRGLEVLPDSILENIRMGRADISIDEVRKALSDLDLLDEISAFSEGVHTVLSGEGRPLSVAQVHRMILARAIVSKPRLVLVDETLDDLDEKSREAALKVLMDKKAPWTLIIATHDVNLAKRCEKTVSLDSLTQRRSG